MRVTYIGQSTVVVESGGQSLIVDPAWLARVGPFFLSTGAYRRAGRTLRGQSFAGVLLTHLHIDHLEPRTLRSLRRSLDDDAPLVFPASARPFVKHGRDPVTRLADFMSAQLLAFAELPRELAGRALYPGQGTPLRLGRFTVTPVPMDHGYEVHGVAPLGCGYVIGAGGQVVYHAGDCVYNAEVVAAVRAVCGAPDLMLVPIGFPGKRSQPREAAQLVEGIRPAAVTPLHYGMPREQEDPGHELSRGVKGRLVRGSEDRAGRSEADDRAWRDALDRIDVALVLPGIVRPLHYGTLAEFKEELDSAGTTAQLRPLERLETLDLG